MGFVLEQSPTFSWPITVKEPVDGGRFRSHTFTAVFKRVSQDRYEELLLQQRDFKLLVERDAEVSSIPLREIADELLVGWADIFEPDNTTQVPYSQEAKAQLLKTAGIANALVETYFEVLEKAKAKN